MERFFPRSYPTGKESFHDEDDLYKKRGLKQSLFNIFQAKSLYTIQQSQSF